MFTKLLSATLIAAVLVSCGANDKKAETPAATATDVAPMPQHQDSAAASTKKDAFSDVKFDSEKDFVCGMPVSAGIEDTAHYKGKVYGFCSKDCKAEFAKTPETFLAKK